MNLKARRVGGRGGRTWHAFEIHRAEVEDACMNGGIREESAHGRGAGGEEGVAVEARRVGIRVVALGPLKERICCRWFPRSLENEGQHNFKTVQKAIESGVASDLHHRLIAKLESKDQCQS